MISLIVLCLIGTSFALPTAPIPEPEPKFQSKGIKENIENAASNIAQNFNDIKDQAQEQITHLPQQIYENLPASIQGVQQAITKPITENQDSYQISFVIPKPSIPSWFPSFPIQLPSFDNWSLPNFLRPQGRYIPGAPSAHYGNEEKNHFYRQLNAENNSENAEDQPEYYIIVFAIPKPYFPSWPSFSGPSYPLIPVQEYNA